MLREISKVPSSIIFNPHHTNYNLKCSYFDYILSRSTNAKFQKTSLHLKGVNYIRGLILKNRLIIQFRINILLKEFHLMSIRALVPLMKPSQQIAFPFIRCRQTMGSQGCCAVPFEFKHTQHMLIENTSKKFCLKFLYRLEYFTQVQFFTKNWSSLSLNCYRLNDLLACWENQVWRLQQNVKSTSISSSLKIVKR